MAPRLRVRNQAMLQAQFPGTSADDVADALIEAAARAAAAAGGAAGMASALPVLPAWPVEVAAETLVVVGIEIKASSTVTAGDFRGLRHLAERTGDDFTAGLVFYTGTQTLPFGPRLRAVPVSALWQT